ncbi:helix-turn-helix domain-containing protein [Spirosoma jeollabukense]
MARPTQYNPNVHPEQARKFCLLGYTDRDLAKEFGISESTLNRWKNKFREFWEALLEGKQIADAEVAQAFYKRAVGFEYPSEKIVTISVGDGCSRVERVPITVVVLPDPSAALNWLKNRRPKEWRDKVEVEHSGKIDTNDLSTLSDEQIEARLKELEAKKSNK